MTGFYRQLRAVDISGALYMLQSDAVFKDTGGTNGWIAQPAWLPVFVAALQLGGTVMYASLRKLPAFQGIPPHTDPMRHYGMRRFHLPLVTDHGVTMRWPDDGVEVHLQAGYLYEVTGFTRLHEVVHRATVDRVHLHVDVVGATEP